MLALKGASNSFEYAKKLKGLGAAGKAALEGAIYGTGASEGDVAERALAGATGAALSAGLAGAARKVLPVKSEQAKQLEKIVVGYTRESGVRGLDKKIAQVVRHAAKSIAMEEQYNIKLTNEDIIEVLKAPRLERDKYENNDVAGVVTGLAWTSVGGDILFIESTVSKGKGTMTMTGNLGIVMKESVTIALEYIRSNAELLGIKPSLLETNNIHIHVPEGATPKDGPSAGIAMLTSMVSSFTQRKIKKNLAMTGEITLRGKVLPVGGIKEKILAAKRANIKEIILCIENKKDIEEINQDYLKGITFHYVNRMSEVIDLAITPQKVKNAKKLV